jgi:hypothetical protein
MVRTLGDAGMGYAEFEFLTVGNFGCVSVESVGKLWISRWNLSVFPMLTGSKEFAMTEQTISSSKSTILFKNTPQMLAEKFQNQFPF